MAIVRANPCDAARLTHIAFTAKRHWGYSERQMADWRELLTITTEFIATHETYSFVSNDSSVGFHALVNGDGKARLEHLWVLPDMMGKGIGRSLFAHAIARAKELGFHIVEIESDPNAEEFYLHMGARRAGALITESHDQRRELPLLVYEIARVD